jgi:hypothetical protein
MASATRASSIPHPEPPQALTDDNVVTPSVSVPNLPCRPSTGRRALAYPSIKGWARSRSSVVQTNLRLPRHSGLTRIGGCRFGYVARHRLVHGFAQCRYLTEQPVEIIARNT